MQKLDEIHKQACSILLGKEEQLKLALVALVSQSHLLIEDVPGVGKTTLVYLYSKLLDLEVSRIQFTNDLLPSDILGTSIYRRETETFDYHKGPIFGEVVLADELNRATPKTQSALLQVMEEKKVSIEGAEYKLDEPFIIIATQNPLYQVGTYPLPESQLDRFFMSIYLDFPAREYEKQILKQKDSRELIENLSRTMTRSDFINLSSQIDSQEVSESLLDYIINLMHTARVEFEYGAYLSPRASKDLLQAAKAYSFIEGRSHVLPDDVQAVAPAVLGHRIGAAKGVRFGHEVIKELIEKVSVVS